MASNIERYSTAAAGLVVVAAFWSVVHPPSYHLLRCIAAAMPIYAGYAETARACATNRIPEGAKVPGLLPHPLPSITGPLGARRRSDAHQAPSVLSSCP